MNAKLNSKIIYAQQQQKRASNISLDRGSRNSKQARRVSSGISSDSNESPRGVDFEYRNLDMQQRVELARRSGKDTAVVNAIKSKLLAEEESKKAGLQ